MRNTFKQVESNSTCLLYPLPIIKDNKYLIEIERGLAPFLIKTFENGFADLPDSFPDYLIKNRTHTDNKTYIYRIDYCLMNYKFLPLRENDISKAKKIEQLISDKIKNVLLKKEDSIEQLLHRIEKQKECKTCQSLGINDSKLEEWINLLIGIHE